MAESETKKRYGSEVPSLGRGSVAEWLTGMFNPCPNLSRISVVCSITGGREPNSQVLKPVNNGEAALALSLFGY